MVRFYFLLMLLLLMSCIKSAPIGLTSLKSSNLPSNVYQAIVSQESATISEKNQVMVDIAKALELAPKEQSIRDQAITKAVENNGNYEGWGAKIKAEVDLAVPLSAKGISIVVATYAKRHIYHERLYENFTSQKVGDLPIELLIFDTGDKKSLFFSAQNLPNVRYHHEESADISLGSKRNWLAQNASYDTIVNFDDDDFYGENYAITMYNNLHEKNSTKLVKLTQWPMASFGPDGKKLTFSYVHPLYTKYGWGFSWVYRKSIFAISYCRFGDKNYAEEDVFSQCVEQRFGEASIKRIGQINPPYIVLKFENSARYLGGNTPLKWSDFGVDDQIDITTSNFLPADQKRIKEILPLFRMQKLTNYANFNRGVIPQGCEKGPCQRNSLISEYNRESTSIMAKDLNQSIPKKDPSHIRVATYNVHYWKNANEGLKLDEIFEVIKNIDPDIIGLQEVSQTPKSQQKMREFVDKKYQEPLFCKSANLFGYEFGNSLLSKYTIASSKIVDLKKNSEGRCAIIAIIDTPLGKITMSTVHLDVFDESGKIREEQIDQLTSALKEAWANQETQILVGDLNAIKKDEIEPFWFERIKRADNARNITTPSSEIPKLEKAGFVDSFKKLKVTPPVSTTWSGRRVDYIFLREPSELSLHGCYIYLSNASDHSVVFCDFKK